MNKYTMIFALGLVSSSAFAADHCEADFRRGISDMKALFVRMTPACQKEVDKGDGNVGGVLGACSGSEIDMAQQMQSIENDRLTPLCQAAECKSIRALGVCVEDQPFSYYLKKLGM